ncbi:MAG: sulfide-dependent adenosine diphosphate thiazole synthase [bacterium]
MKIDDIIVSKSIIESWSNYFVDSLELDVAIVGGGPAGLTAGYYLAKKGFKVGLYEKNLSIGGGMWGGGMMFNKCVFQDESKSILDEFGIKTQEYEKGYFITDSIETVTTLCSKAVQAGLRVFNLISVEDVMIREQAITGLVLSWSAVEIAKLHVDPLTIRAKFVIDTTGHAAHVANIIIKRIGKKLFTETGNLIGEGSMWAEVGEQTIVQNTKEIFPNVYVAGMACNAVFGGPRMGPIFGGMLLSGKKIAEILIEKLK